MFPAILLVKIFPEIENSTESFIISRTVEVEMCAVLVGIGTTIVEVEFVFGLKM